MNKLTRGEVLQAVMKRLTIRSLDDLYATVGFGGLSSAQVLAKLSDEYAKKNKIISDPAPPPEAPPTQITLSDDIATKAERDGGTHVSVKGLGNMLVRFARCCTPVPGDEIIGYTTRGRGVSIHRMDCTNIIHAQHNATERGRLIDVSWSDTSTADGFIAEIQIIGYDRVGMLADLTNTIAKEGIHVVGVSAKADSKTNTTAIHLALKTQNIEQLDRLIQKIQSKTDVMEVYRR